MDWKLRESLVTGIRSFIRKTSKISNWIPSYRYFGSARRRLRIGNRAKLPASHFAEHHKLYRAFDLEDVDSQTERLKVASIPFPDLSCNWSLFSLPEDVRLRPGAHQTDGCYSFTVTVARYQRLANPVHDPIRMALYENYSHVEVRELAKGEGFEVEPPPRRRFRSKTRKSRRLEYRQNLALRSVVELTAT